MAQGQSFLQAMLQDRFKAGLFILLLILFVFLMVPGQDTQTKDGKPLSKTEAVVHVFYSPECPHCRKELAFLEDLKTRYSDLEVQAHNITTEQELSLMLDYMIQHHLSLYQIGTPFLVIGDQHLVGFHEPETSGVLIEGWVKKALSGQAVETTEKPGHTKKTLDLPIFGEIHIFETSLPVLAVVLGLVDGFNPCAMWVLVYLISLIIGLKDRTKIYTLVGTFLMASGLLYFLFMTAWLNVFLYIGYVHIITVLIGLAALYMGILSLRGFIASGGQIVCKVGDIKSRQKTRTKIQELVASPLTWASFAGIVALAFAVNSIEFVCSSAMPALFTHVLSVANLPGLTYYFYILIYVMAFMLDDFIIFMAAALAVDRFAGEKYAGFCKLVGGILMVGLGLVLAFFPEVLR